MILTGESRFKTGIHLNSIPYLTENTFFIAKSRQLMFFSQNPSVFMVVFKHNVGSNFVGIAFGRHWDFKGVTEFFY